MFVQFYRHLARRKTPLRDFGGAAQLFVRSFFLPGRRVGEQSLKLLDNIPLTAQTSVALVRFERETLVLGVTPQRVTVLAKGSAPDLTGESAPKS
jgi:flagellar biogenesis protein FliO